MIHPNLRPHWRDLARCEDCSFFKSSEPPGSHLPGGKCRYNPPHHAWNAWPDVDANHWCGKFQKDPRSKP